jgi:putative Mg2+ transporter-C (MgtC) family protein
MPLSIDWSDISVRLALTVASGLVIGLNRSTEGRPAGVRTTILVALAAALSMLQANLLLATRGKASDSFVVLDLMRLPLGVLSGMGFIGAGAILRKENLVVGITTAATLWFMTLIGFCFGAGELGLGITGTILGAGLLWGVKPIERAMPHKSRAELTITLNGDRLSEGDLRTTLAAGGCQIQLWAFSDLHGGAREIHCEVEWRGRFGEACPPEVIQRLRAAESVASIRWQPHGSAAS